MTSRKSMSLYFLNWLRAGSTLHFDLASDLCCSRGSKQASNGSSQHEQAKRSEQHSSSSSGSMAHCMQVRLEWAAA